jgi:3',5'-nucleoside bisphosphate phosphatase
VRPSGLTLVLGSELSCLVDVPALGRSISMHLLAYGFDPEEPELAAERQRMRRARLDRVENWQRLLHDDGYDLSLEPLRAKALSGMPVGRPHFASLLVEAGLVPTHDAAFDDQWLGERYRVRREGWDVYDAMAKVAAAGGATVFAHPYARLRGAVVGEPEIRKMAAAGLTGIEVDHPDHAPQDREALRRMANELGLVITGSSDYHGSRKQQDLGAESTAEVQFERLLAGVTGRAAVTDPA